MKTGKSLVELAQEIERQRESRVDYIAATSATVMAPNADATDVVVSLNGADPLLIRDHAHGQVATFTNVPRAYYDRMRSQAPALLSQNVNHWLQAEPANRMVRCLDGRVRAYLSDKYRPLENADLAEAVLPLFIGSDLQLVSCEITERRLYIKAVDRRVVREINGRRVVDGRMVEFDSVSPSITISNSEVGAGALAVESGMFTHACKNMALFREKSMRKYHVGGRHEIADGVVAMLSERTRQLTDQATWAQVRDVVAGALNADVFTARVQEVQGLTERKITGDPVKVVDLAAKSLDIRDLEKPSILRHLIEGADLSQYGLFNAITRAAEDLSDYDRATDFERIGGKVIELAPTEWSRISEAA